jgi:hypothetical protein
MDEQLARSLAAALVRGHGMNELLHEMLAAVGDRLGADRATLYDYDELTGVFDLLYFQGYPSDARSRLSRRMLGLNLAQALKQHQPFWTDPEEQVLLVPLYLQEVLEAVLLLEDFREPPRSGDPRWDSCRLVSRFLGLFMSSSRLPANQKANPLTLSDLERARSLQLRYLPEDHPATDRYEIFGYNQSSALVGGDYFDYFRQREGSIQFIVADACGHGMAAALIMSTFRGLLLSEMRRNGDLESLFNRLNQMIFTDGEIIQYLTTVFFDFEEEQGRLHYWNAGHFDPLLVHPDGSHCALSGGGPPLGMFHRSTYELGRHRVSPGDLLVLFTDGLAELRNRDDEFFGISGILDSVVRHRNRELRELAHEVLHDAMQFSQKAAPEDDLTLFLMRIR